MKSYTNRFEPELLLENEKVGLFHVEKMIKRKESPMTWSLRGENGLVTLTKELKGLEVIISENFLGKLFPVNHGKLGPQMIPEKK